MLFRSINNAVIGPSVVLSNLHSGYDQTKSRPTGADPLRWVFGRRLGYVRSWKKLKSLVTLPISATVGPRLRYRNVRDHSEIAGRGGDTDLWLEQTPHLWHDFNDVDLADGNKCCDTGQRKADMSSSTNSMSFAMRAEVGSTSASGRGSKQATKGRPSGRSLTSPVSLARNVVVPVTWRMRIDAYRLRPVCSSANGREPRIMATLSPDMR